MVAVLEAVLAAHSLGLAVVAVAVGLLVPVVFDHRNAEIPVLNGDGPDIVGLAFRSIAETDAAHVVGLL